MNLTIVIINTVVVIVVIIMMMDQELLGKLEMADTRSENAEMDIGRLNVRIDKVVVMVTMMMFNILSHVLTPRWRRTLWWRSQRSSKCLMTSMQSLMSSCEAWNLQYILQL